MSKQGSRHAVTRLVRVGSQYHKWYTDTINRLHTCNHLGQTEKEQAINLFSRQLYYFDRFLNNYRDRKQMPEDVDGGRLTGDFHREQVRFNQAAQYYELPVFPLPKIYDDPFRERGYNLRVSSDEFQPVLWKNYELYTRLMEPGEVPDDNRFILVCYRPAPGQPRRYIIGWSGGFTARKFILKRDHPRLALSKPDIKIFRGRIVHFLAINEIVYDVKRYEQPWHQQEGGQAA